MTREEAIKILQGAIKKPNTKDGYLGQALDMAIKALEQEPKTGWIPVSKRLPEDDNDVLVQMNDYSMMVDFIAASSSGWFWAEKDDLPIAWMPLPDPFEPQE